MIPNASVQHRVKHFDLLLARELEYIKREHQQNLITHKNLEKSIIRDSNRTINLNRKKILIPIHENFNEQNEKSSSSIVSSNYNHSHIQIDETPSEVFPQFHRNCFKSRRLPPIVKLNRRKRTNNDIHWIASIQSTNAQKENFSEINAQNENFSDIYTVLTDELPKVSLPEPSPLQKQIRSFMETLPTYKGLQRGFDNFAPASLYSRRAPVAMR
jgi:hypothetical protein